MPGTLARLLPLAALLALTQAASAQDQTGTLEVTISLQGTGSWRDPSGDATTVAIDRMLQAKVAIRAEARSASNLIGQHGVPDVTGNMPSPEEQMAIAREAQACGRDAACLQELAARITALQQPRMTDAGRPGRYVVWSPDPLESAACLLGWTEKVDDVRRATDGNTGETVTTTVRVSRQTPSFLLPVSDTPPICSTMALFTVDSRDEAWTFSPVMLMGSHVQAKITNRGEETSTRTELVEPFGFHLTPELNPHLVGIDLRALVFRGSGATRGDTAITVVLGSPGEEIRAQLAVSWSARLEAEEQDVRIAISGPTCGCMNVEDAVGEPLSFAATTSLPGGKFEEFEIRADGEAPRVIINEGGATPRLQLAATPRTGRVTLSIVYDKDGDRYTAPGFAVSFCAIDSIRIAGGTADLSFDAASPARLEVDASAGAWYNGQEVSSALEWSLEAMSDGTSLAPGEATGASVLLAYEGLPDRNTAFGEKTLTVRAEKGECACERETQVRAFFAPADDNHPPGDGGTGANMTGAPNWYYYWMQTQARQGHGPNTFRYRSTIPGDNPGERVVARTWRDEQLILLSDLIVDPEAMCTGRSKGTDGRESDATGIDCFAEAIRHEARHLEEHRMWWVGNSDNAAFDDRDGDYIPTSVEEEEPGCLADEAFSCANRPFPYVGDQELFAYYEGWAWRLGTADADDWSCGGKQWEGGTCPE